MHDKRSACCCRRCFGCRRARFRGGEGSGFAAAPPRATHSATRCKEEETMSESTVSVTCARTTENKERSVKQNNEKNMADHVVMKTPPIIAAEEWEAARQQLLVKEKALTRARDVLAAERRRMPWLAVPKKYEFEGQSGKVSL